MIMSTTEPKTQKTNASVEDFINNIPDEKQRADCKVINEMMQKATGEKPAMWGPAIIGYGTYHYIYASGRQGDWPKVGFSPRKGKTTLYLSSQLQVNYPSQMAKLGKHSTSKACLYIKHLSDVDPAVLFELIENSYKELASGVVSHE